MKTVDPFLRSTMYKHLSLFYSYPDKRNLSQFKKNQKGLKAVFNNLASEMSIPIKQEIDYFSSSLNHVSLLDLQSEYVRLFDYRCICHLYESIALRDQVCEGNPAELQIAVENFYKRYGIIPLDAASNPADHIITEFEFMHFLAFNEGDLKRKEEADREKFYVQGEKDFLEQHIIQWVPGICDKLEGSSKISYFNLLAVITRSFVTEDLDYLISREVVLQ